MSDQKAKLAEAIKAQAQREQDLNAKIAQCQQKIAATKEKRAKLEAEFKALSEEKK